MKRKRIAKKAAKKAVKKRASAVRPVSPLLLLFVRSLARDGAWDSCEQLKGLIKGGQALEVQEHISGWLRACARGALGEPPRGGDI